MSQSKEVNRDDENVTDESDTPNFCIIDIEENIKQEKVEKEQLEDGEVEESNDGYDTSQEYSRQDVIQNDGEKFHPYGYNKRPRIDSEGVYTLENVDNTDFSARNNNGTETVAEKDKENEVKEAYAKIQEEQWKKLTRLFVRKVNTVDFIYVIEKKPSIWDSRVEGYSNQREKLKSWKEVLVYFIPDFESMKIEEKNILVKIVQKKWRGIRVCYARELRLKHKTQKSGSGVSNRKQYAFFDQLQFLEIIPKKAANSTDVEEDEDGNEVEQRADLNNSQSPGNIAPLVTMLQPKTTRKRGLQNVEDKLIAAPKKKAAQDAEEDRDEDKLFLLSLVSEMKKVPPENRLQLCSNIISAIAQAQKQHWPPFPSPHVHYPTQTTHFPNSGPHYIQPQQFAPQHNSTQHNEFSLNSQNVVNSNQQSKYQSYSNMPSSPAVNSVRAQDRLNNYEGFS